jgi:hypothetical protein
MSILLTHILTFVVVLAVVPLVWAMLEYCLTPRSN